MTSSAILALGTPLPQACFKSVILSGMVRGVTPPAHVAMIQTGKLIPHAWFVKTLSSPTSDDIEMRLCSSASNGAISTPIEIVELYVQ